MPALRRNLAFAHLQFHVDHKHHFTWAIQDSKVISQPSPILSILNWAWSLIFPEKLSDEYPCTEGDGTRNSKSCHPRILLKFTTTQQAAGGSAGLGTGLSVAEGLRC
eukprot:CAMPEP_0184293656 /NCGR_PEP_ID=MMETSP1049-20130417/5023_1 /TAXON_ID=77928 /ORGANISM="Proteomonas sulcata, Strain CCMP704" /LENGTH=106 /DNA_ID=CAMNT_0026601681 /DNA_START=310 /DNA_END=630 /DNA_ORIENTATION=+